MKGWIRDVHYLQNGTKGIDITVETLEGKYFTIFTGMRTVPVWKGEKVEMEYKDTETYETSGVELYQIDWAKEIK